MSNHPKSNAIAIPPTYLFWHLLYEDFTRRQAYFRLAGGADDRYLNKMTFGTTIESVHINEEDSPPMRLTVANYPAKVRVEHPAGSGRFIEQIDICFAPHEQWMLYAHALPEDIPVDLEIIDPDSPDEL